MSSSYLYARLEIFHSDQVGDLVGGVLEARVHAGAVRHDAVHHQVAVHVQRVALFVVRDVFEPSPTDQQTP